MSEEVKIPAGGPSNPLPAQNINSFHLAKSFLGKWTLANLPNSPNSGDWGSKTLVLCNCTPGDLCLAHTSNADTALSG